MTTPRTGTPVWYPSKVDWWLAVVLCLPPVASVAVTVSLVLDGRSSELIWGLASILLVIGVYGGLIFPTRYGLDASHLIVRFGLCRRRIPLRQISEVEPTRNPLSSPALSLDRLSVHFGTGLLGTVMISPSARDRFLDDLAGRADLTREGDRLVRIPVSAMGDGNGVP